MVFQILLCSEVALFRGLNLVIRGRRLGNATTKFSIPNIYAGLYRIRLLSSESDAKNSFAGHNKKREDLERLKQLLHREKAPEKKADATTTIQPEEDQTSYEPKDSQTSSVDANKLKHLLSSLTIKRETPSSRDRKAVRPRKKTSTGRVAKNEERQEEETSKGVGVLRETKRVTHSVDASKIKDVLSSLGQDITSSPAEDVLLAGRRPQLSADSVSAMEGALHIKQRQIRDKDTKKKIPRNSLRVGPRLHWFDDVKSEWSSATGASETAGGPSLFQEMAEQEVLDMGTSVAVQSGFHDLIENIDRQWSFPIDNETCKTEEREVGFEQHVFLEHMLEEFPTSGNIRQFMELVVSGLQQNPHLTVNEKKEHILWFKDYFEQMPEELVQL